MTKYPHLDKLSLKEFCANMIPKIEYINRMNEVPIGKSSITEDDIKTLINLFEVDSIKSIHYWIHGAYQKPCIGIEFKLLPSPNGSTELRLDGKAFQFIEEKGLLNDGVYIHPKSGLYSLRLIDINWYMGSL